MTDHDADSRLQRSIDHYMKDMGAMPEALQQLNAVAPDVFAAYSELRGALFKSEADGGKLPLRYKHLICVVLDAVRDEPIGVVNHTRAAMLAGLTVDELVEGILSGIIVYGMPIWGKVGRKAVDFAVEFQKELDAEAVT